jgi:hypothetical protein
MHSSLVVVVEAVVVAGSFCFVLFDNSIKPSPPSIIQFIPFEVVALHHLLLLVVVEEAEAAAVVDVEADVVEAVAVADAEEAEVKK